MKNKWMKVACIIAVLTIVAVVAVVFGMQAADRKRWEEERENTTTLIIEAVSKVASEYNLTSEFVRYEDLEGYDRLVYVEVDDFQNLSPEEMGDFFEKLGRIGLSDVSFKELDDTDLEYDKMPNSNKDTYGGAVIILSGDEEYSYTDNFVWHGDHIDKNIVYKYEHGSGTSSSTSGAKGKKCINCNGTGYVKYYYGSSDLEAILSGHDTYTTGPCSMCDGTGYDN